MQFIYIYIYIYVCTEFQVYSIKGLVHEPRPILLIEITDAFRNFRKKISTNRNVFPRFLFYFCEFCEIAAVKGKFQSQTLRFFSAGSAF